MWIVFLLVIMETADLEELRKIIDTKIIYLVSGDFGCTNYDYTSKFRHNLPKQNTKKYTNLCFYIKNHSASMVLSVNLVQIIQTIV